MSKASWLHRRSLVLGGALVLALAPCLSGCGGGLKYTVDDAALEQKRDLLKQNRKTAQAHLEAAEAHVELEKAKVAQQRGIKSGGDLQISDFENQWKRKTADYEAEKLQSKKLKG